jgi:hypothetical protein
MNDNFDSGYIDIDEYINSNILVKNNIYFLPSLHGRLEFGAAVSILMKSIDFDAVALELPDFMKRHYMEGIGRLPYISAVCIQTGGGLNYHLIEPQDAMCEAARELSARGGQAHIHFIDRFIDDYRGGQDNFPDPYSVYGAGLVNYCAEYYKIYGVAALNERAHEDLMREQFMAANLERLSAKYSKVLFVCGIYHYPAIFNMLDYKNAIPFYNVKIDRVYLANLAKSSHESVLSEYPFIIKHFEAARNPAPSLSRCGPVPAAILRPGGDNLYRGGVAVSGGGEAPSPDNVFKLDFAGKTCRAAQNCDAAGGGTFFQDAVPETASAAEARNNISSLEYGLKIGAIEKRFSFERPAFLDRALLNLKLLKIASVNYEKNTGSEIGHNYFNIMLKFLSNYIRLKGSMAAGIYDLLMAARASVDDNYAYEVFEAAAQYPWIDNSQKFVTLELGLKDLKIDGKTVRFHRRLKSVRQIFAPYLKKRKKEEKPGDWLREWKENEDSICSYPPEDLMIENFGDYLKKKAAGSADDEHARLEPFSTSLMDGVDMRETIRNYHIDGRIFVKISRRSHGAAGTVVMIFDDDHFIGAPHNEKYPYKMTWLGEHGQESDMAFYSTVPGDKIAGPGISRCEYGGFMLSYPPMRLYDIWHDPAYFAAKNKPETLLMAALDYSLEKIVVYCAKKPPRTFFKTIAARLGKKIIYVPIGQFSHITVEKLKVMHILSGKKIRETAKDYIW